MMKILAAAAVALGVIGAAPALAADAPAKAATPTAKPAYSTTQTPIGDLLDDPAAKAILVKDLPGLVDDQRIDMARGMTLKQVQTYAPQQITDEKLAAVDADFAKLAAK